MYRIGELAKLAEVTPDTIRYYEKQQMMEHEVRTEGVSGYIRKRIFNGLNSSAMPDSLALPLSRSVNCYRSASILNIIPVRNPKGSCRTG